MYFVVDSRGNFWDGWGWSEQGRPFLTVSAALRSLHEEGEDPDRAKILEVPRAATPFYPAGDSPAG